MSEWVEWDDLPFQECPGPSLRELTRDLTQLLPEVDLDDIEEEVVEFTEKRGWHKLDKLMPALFEDTLGYAGPERLLERIRQFSDHWKASGLPLF
jgi:hypothetical protein